MTELTQAEIRKFWENCGWHYSGDYWLNREMKYAELPNSSDLNAVFETALPLCRKNPVLRNSIANLFGWDTKEEAIAGIVRAVNASAQVEEK